jgi:hypothetical protein
MRIISATIGPLAAASATAIAASQSGTGGTALTLTSSPCTLDFARRIIITCAGDDSLHTFTIVGKDWNGTPVTETLAGATAGNAAQSVYDYTVITSITPVQNTTSTVTVGTNAVSSTRPIFLDEYGFAPTAIQVNVSGTASVTVQQSLDDPNVVGYTSVNWINHPDTNLINITANVQGNYAYLPKVVRLLLNSGATGTAYATIRLSQSAAVPF